MDGTDMLALLRGPGWTVSAKSSGVTFPLVLYPGGGSKKLWSNIRTGRAAEYMSSHGFDLQG